MTNIWHKAIVRQIDNISSGVKHFVLESDAWECNAPFRAGQFVTLELPIHEKRHKRWRSYSVASAPAQGSKAFELCIVRLDDGLGTSYLFDDVKVGDELTYKGPLGSFVLSERRLAESSHIVMICTGTGVAPFRSMLYDSLHTQGLNSPEFRLVFGTRQIDGLLYRDEFEAMEKQYPNFRYAPTLSREPDWAGHKGYVHGVYTQWLRDGSISSERSTFYLCGWSGMIDEARRTLMDMGIAEENIIYEMYG